MRGNYNLGGILKDLRKTKKLTQKQLAAQIGLTTTAVSKYELNESVPPLDVLRILASVFGVSIDYLAGIEKAPSIPTTGLTKEQLDIINELATVFVKQNKSQQRSLQNEQFMILGNIVTEFLKK